MGACIVLAYSNLIFLPGFSSCRSLWGLLSSLPASKGPSGLVEEETLCLCCCLCSWDLFFPLLEHRCQRCPCSMRMPQPLWWQVYAALPHVPTPLHPTPHSGCCSLIEYVISANYRESFSSKFQQVSGNFTMKPIHWGKEGCPVLDSPTWLIEQGVCPFPIFFFKVMPSTCSLSPLGSMSRLSLGYYDLHMFSTSPSLLGLARSCASLWTTTSSPVIS